MVMQVGKVPHILFRANNVSNVDKKSPATENRTTELANRTPDFGITVPQSYKKIGVTKTSNGLEIHSYKLANGHRVTIVPMEDSPTIVKNYVNVGSMNETDDIKGISHFLEHMAFNGTNGTEGYIKLARGDSFKKIDEMGGWTNASTNYSLTDFVNSTPMLEEKDLEQQIKILASMAEDLKLSPDMVEKEKNPVSSEIDMILDDPFTVAIDQTVRTLFNVKSSADELIGGSVKHIQKLDRQKVLDYYNKYYTPDNMHLVITGNVNPNSVMDIVSKNFRSVKHPQGQRYDEKITPINNKVRKDFISDKSQSCKIVIGFSGPKPSSAKDAVITDIVSEYLGYSGAKLKDDLTDLYASGYFGCEKISTNLNNPIFMFYSVSCNEDNSEEVLKKVMKDISSLKTPDEKTLKSIKDKMITSFNNNIESSLYINDVVGVSAFNKNIEYLTEYEDILSEITAKDIQDYINKYLDVNKSAITVVHPVTNEETILNNYLKANSVSFKGKHRLPVNPDKVSETTLDNNVRLGISESKNKNTPFVLTLHYDIPQNINPAAYLVLTDIFERGSKSLSGKNFDKYVEDNNLSSEIGVGKTSLVLSASSSKENLGKMVELSKDVLYRPLIEEEFDKSVARIKENYIKRYEKSAIDLFDEYESKNNPIITTYEDIKSGIDKLTVDDVKALHEYIINNSKCTVVVNLPEGDTKAKESVEHMFSSLKAVKPYSYELRKIYAPNETAKVLTKEKNVSQAEINQIYKFETDDSAKNEILASLMNYLLSSSHSIGLFNSLREHDHLAYRVNSNYSKSGDCGIVSLNILTSTDNKDTGVETFDNLQKSIMGFNRQINKLLNSKYTDEDLETAKHVLKAQYLDKESVFSRLYSLENSIYENKNLDYENQLFDMIDSITREDIDKFSRKVFEKAPVYSIVASKDTLEYNKDFLQSLENSN